MGCTRQYCDPSVPPPRDNPCANVCDGGSVTAPDGCNTCTCLNGQMSACTEKACVTPKPQCVDGETTNDGCNSCSCVNGRMACTLRYCPPSSSSTSSTTGNVGVCQQPAGVTGPCRAAMPRFTYNARTASCQRFTYGGCAGNENNFVTQAECERTCGKISDIVDDDMASSTQLSIFIAAFTLISS